MTGLAGQVEEVVLALHQVAETVLVADVRYVHPNGVFKLANVETVAAVFGDQTVHELHFGAQPGQPAGQRRSDEPQPPGDQNSLTGKDATGTLRCPGDSLCAQAPHPPINSDTWRARARRLVFGRRPSLGDQDALAARCGSRYSSPRSASSFSPISAQAFLHLGRSRNRLRPFQNGSAGYGGKRILFRAARRFQGIVLSFRQTECDHSTSCLSFHGCPPAF